MNPLYVLLPPIFIIAGYTEMKKRRIPNWLTGSAVICGLGGAFITAGTAGLWDSFLGMLIGGGVFLPFCLAGVLGGGDMKLMAAVGAILGFKLILAGLYYTCLAGGVLAFIYMIWTGHFLDSFANMFRILTGRKAKKREGLRKTITIPYGIAIAVGTLCAIYFSGR